MAFLRPGTLSSGAFGISFDADKDKDQSSNFIYNRNERLAIRDQRGKLPIAKFRLEILYLVENKATTIIVGETGCGKTTQIPQYLLEAGWAKDGRMIACTQPRRVAAMSVALRVAEETGTRLGEDVGYSIRFEDVSTPGTTKIKFMTDGVLLRAMMQDPLLTKYSVIMVDEAHERSVASDVLLGLLRKVQSRRPDLRLIIASATLEAKKLKNFFDARTQKIPGAQNYLDPAIISIAGRTYPVEVHYVENPVSNYVEASVNTALEIHKTDYPGDILIFLPGQYDCELVVERLRAENETSNRRQKTRLMPLPLYSGLPARNQLQVFQPTPRGCRKVVCATNIAETSVTIDGIVFVVDCCFVKTKIYNPITGLDALITVPIDKASATQRAGRAGRVRPGHCFRLCTESYFVSEMHGSMVPEIQRSDLSTTVMQLKALGVDNIMKFKWVDPPPAESMVKALELLHALGALNGDGRLSRPVGIQMSEMPLEPPLAKCLLISGELGCSSEMATVASLLCVRSVWAPVKGEIKALERAKERFAVAEGDLVTYLNVHRAWVSEGRSAKWCSNNYVSHKALLRAEDIRNQLLGYLKGLGVPIQSCDRDLEPLLKCIASGYCMNAVQFQKMNVDIAMRETNVYKMVRLGDGDEKLALKIHVSSVLARCKPLWAVFHFVEQDDRGLFNMRDVTAIEQSWLVEMCPHLYELK